MPIQNYSLSLPSNYEQKKDYKLMETTIIILLSVAVLVLVVLLAVVLWRYISQGDEIKTKNDVIVREVRRNLELRQRAEC